MKIIESIKKQIKRPTVEERAQQKAIKEFEKAELFKLKQFSK